MNRSDFAASVATSAPEVGGNFWPWLASHDINWWVALLTAGHILLQAFYLIKNGGRKGRMNLTLLYAELRRDEGLVTSVKPVFEWPHGEWIERPEMGRLLPDVMGRTRSTGEIRSRAAYRH